MLVQQLTSTLKQFTVDMTQTIYQPKHWKCYSNSNEWMGGMEFPAQLQQDWEASRQRLKDNDMSAITGHCRLSHC